MNLREARARYGNLNSLRSAIDGLIETARALEAEDPDLLASVYSAANGRYIVALGKKTRVALEELRARELK